MTLKQFQDKYLGKQVEYHSFDPNAKYQCVDLVNQFIVDVLGLDPLIGTNAKDFPTKINKNQFDVLENTPDFKPIENDIPTWNGKVGGGSGHIAVVRDNKATLKSFNSLDQNWSKPLYVTLETHNYTNVTHFLRAKVSSLPPVTPTTDDLQKILTHYNVKTADEFIPSNDQQLKYLDKARIEVGVLQEALKKSTDDHKDFVAFILGMVNSFGNPAGLSDEYLAIKDVSSLVDSVSQSQQALKDQQKIAEEAARISADREKELKGQIDQLTKKANDLGRQVLELQNDIDKVRQNQETQQSQTAQINAFQDLISKLSTLFKRK